MLESKAWVCPDCGQWGRECFGRHRLPEASVIDPTSCSGEPLLVELGPLLRHHTRLAAAWLRHIDRLDEIPGAKIGMPRHNPLWDAGIKLEETFG